MRGCPRLSPGRLQPVQGAAQRFQLAFVGVLLVLRLFHEPQHLLHLFQRLLQRLDDLPDFLNRPADD